MARSTSVTMSTCRVRIRSTHAPAGRPTSRQSDAFHRREQADLERRRVQHEDGRQRESQLAHHGPEAANCLRRPEAAEVPMTPQPAGDRVHGRGGGAGHRHNSDVGIASSANLANARRVRAPTAVRRAATGHRGSRRSGPAAGRFLIAAERPLDVASPSMAVRSSRYGARTCLPARRPLWSVRRARRTRAATLVLSELGVRTREATAIATVADPHR